MSDVRSGSENLEYALRTRAYRPNPAAGVFRKLLSGVARILGRGGNHLGPDRRQPVKTVRLDTTMDGAICGSAHIVDLLVHLLNRRDVMCRDGYVARKLKQRQRRIIFQVVRTGAGRLPSSTDRSRYPRP